MKLKTSALTILAALMATSAVAAPTAQQLEDRVFGSVFAEYYYPDLKKQTSAEYDRQREDTGYGFNVGYYINDSWAVRAELLRQNLKNDLQQDVKGNRAGIDVMYFVPESYLYFVGGVKNITTGKSVSAANVGLGANVFATDNLAVFFEANRFQGVSDSFKDAGLKLGLSYVFGGASTPEPTAAPAPAVEAPVAAFNDADKDGVADEQDQCANTPMTDKVDEVGCSIFTEKSVTIRLDAQFDNNSAEIKAEYKADIERLADFLKRYPNTDVEIGGHASNVGSAPYNLKLSQRRADAVAAVLVNEHGIDSSRVKAVGYGITKPLATGNSAEAHKMNRRIEGVVTATVKDTVKR